MGREWMMVAATAALIAVSVIASRPAMAGGCQDSGAQSIAFESLEHYQNGPYRSGTILMANSANDWNAATEKLAIEEALSLYPVDIPNVKWGEQSVIMVAMGECPSLGYDIIIENVWKETDRIVVGVRYVHPGEGSQLSAMSSPYHMICIDAVGIDKIEICETNATAARIERRLSPPGNFNNPENSARTTTTWSDLKSRIAS